MGQCCESCIRAFGLASSEYTPISNGDIDLNKSVEIVFPQDNYHKITSPATVSNTTSDGVFHSVPDVKDELASAKEFDLNSVVFKGTVVEQKFSNKSTYDNKFAWINFTNRTLNLSEHMTKERRHKEASLSDVINVVAGPPEKYKSPPNDTEKLNPHLCLSVKFVRGGGIDLKFKSVVDRDIWFDVITRLVLQQTKIETEHRK